MCKFEEDVDDEVEVDVKFFRVEELVFDDIVLDINQLKVAVKQALDQRNS